MRYFGQRSKQRAGFALAYLRRMLTTIWTAATVSLLVSTTTLAEGYLSPLITPPTNQAFLQLTKQHNTQATTPDSIEKANDPEQKGLLRIYRSNLLKKTYQHVVYPDSAIDNNHEGDVVLRITIDRSGKVKKIAYDSRAAFNSLNKAAKKAVRHASPFPAVPKRVKGKTFELQMPIRFKLTG